ncbi:MAG TPA: spore coat protein U domain-containing protein [Candidatus Baltobacteraceae bacterium]|nr:spore coat protein U domain-containing protein [Candidatus Baltobacteraceae bacterium]
MRATLLFTAALFVISIGVAAATTNQSVTVTGNVIADCTTVPSTGTLALGAYNPFSSVDLAPSTPFQFSINCTRGDTTFTVAVDGGANFAAANPTGNRAMQDSTGSYLTYQLYEDSAHATAWPFSTASGQGTPVSLIAGGIAASNTISLYGVVPHGQSSSTDAGAYNDTVHVTVNY